MLFSKNWLIWLYIMRKPTYLSILQQAAVCTRYNPTKTQRLSAKRIIVYFWAACKWWSAIPIQITDVTLSLTVLIFPQPGMATKRVDKKEWLLRNYLLWGSNFFCKNRQLHINTCIKSYCASVLRIPDWIYLRSIL